VNDVGWRPKRTADDELAGQEDECSYAGRVRFEVLGPLRVVEGFDHAGEDEAGLRLGGARQQVVLAMLLASPNSVVSTDALVDGLWGDSPPSAARHTVQSYVSELRKLLGPVIERDGTGYVARVDASSLDSLEFAALIGEGRAVFAEHPDVAAETLRTALRLWRGPPFSGLADADVLLPERSRLEELLLLALEDRVAADLASGRHREVAAELEALSREHPYREGLRAQHMLALYRSGRQAEALRAFQQTRAVLVDELGIEPSPQLRQLEEQILVQDPALDLASAAAESAVDPCGPAGNPYVGLRAFNEADADNFYGRDELTEQLVSVVAGEARFTAVVGPSGSGKSSLVQAGLIPAIRTTDSPGASWVIAVMRPGAYPFTELEAALVHAGDPSPAMSGNLLWGDESQLLRAVLRILPEGSRLLLVIDQFEELFTLVDDDQRDRFLSSLVTLATDPRGRSRVLVTLRADFYDRPLMHPTFGRMMTGHVVNVMPLAADELEAAALGPALGAGVTFERGLLSELIAEVSGQPNALPLFQYTLTELFERRQDSILTRAAYEALGRIRGAVASRAEEIYRELGPEQQEAARQLFLRLVNVGRDSVTRRVATASELVALDVDVVTMHAAVEAFVTSRLLVRDRDPFSGALTIEVAHEALLTEWERLRQWIDTGREQLRQHGAYLLVVDEWLTAGRDPDYLLTGGRLDQYEQWRATTTMRLTDTEREFLDEALRRREQAEAIEAARAAQQAGLRRRARRRAFALGAAAAAITTAAIVAVVTAGGTGNAVRVGMVSSAESHDQPGESYEQGLVRAERDFDLTVDRRDFQDSPDGVITELAAGEIDLVILDPIASRRRAHVNFDLDPDIHYVLTGDDTGAPVSDPNVTSLYWAEEEGGFLAGVAAATTTRTGIVGFLGAFNGGGQEDTRAGFEAGAHSIDPDIEVRAAYMADVGFGGAAYDSPEGGQYVANLLYDFGADVIFHDVGGSGAGVLQAASELSTNHRWVIGSDTDQWQLASTQERPHVLTSIVKDFGLPIYTMIEDYLDDSLEAGPRRLNVADGMITYATSGDALSADARATLDRTIQQLASGAIQPPRIPTGEVTDQESLETPRRVVANIPITFTVPTGWSRYGGGVFNGPLQYFAEPGVWKGGTGDPIFGVTFWIIDNLYVDNCGYVPFDPPVGRTVDALAEAWASMPGFNATTPIDITVDGFSGKQVEFTIPDYTQDEDCNNNGFELWQHQTADAYFGYTAEGPNEHRLLRILDVDGARLVISASYLPDASPQDRADLDEILNSIRLL
jgi:basic membrane lipoprotein Med (substrate-binding protein (PBP1-ABC) superfamily)/DNA-binding SARP family transcriptional activator/energy-coupling factor transporter ATP-binding protein EcfA2